MGIGVSVFLIAVGAILAFAVEFQANGVDLTAVGYILMVVGAIGLLASLIIWGGWARGPVADDYVEEPPVTRRRVIRRGY